jgi:hypothetical protein
LKKKDEAYVLYLEFQQKLIFAILQELGVRISISVLVLLVQDLFTKKYHIIHKAIAQAWKLQNETVSNEKMNFLQ